MRCVLRPTGPAAQPDPGGHRSGPARRPDLLLPCPRCAGLLVLLGCTFSGGARKGSGLPCPPPDRKLTGRARCGSSWCGCTDRAGPRGGRARSWAYRRLRADRGNPGRNPAAGRRCRGIVGGRGLAAALAMGAAGVHCGTAFLATTECFAHDMHKRRLVAAHASDTVLTDIFVLNWPRGAAVRVLANSVTMRRRPASGSRPRRPAARAHRLGRRRGPAAIEHGLASALNDG